MVIYLWTSLLLLFTKIRRKTSKKKDVKNNFKILFSLFSWQQEINVTLEKYSADLIITMESSQHLSYVIVRFCEECRSLLSNSFYALSRPIEILHRGSNMEVNLGWSFGMLWIWPWWTWVWNRATKI